MTPTNPLPLEVLTYQIRHSLRSKVILKCPQIVRDAVEKSNTNSLQLLINEPLFPRVIFKPSLLQLALLKCDTSMIEWVLAHVYPYNYINNKELFWSLKKNDSISLSNELAKAKNPWLQFEVLSFIAQDLDSSITHVDTDVYSKLIKIQFHKTIEDLNDFFNDFRSEALVRTNPSNNVCTLDKSYVIKSAQNLDLFSDLDLHLLGLMTLFCLEQEDDDLAEKLFVMGGMYTLSVETLIDSIQTESDFYQMFRDNYVPDLPQKLISEFLISHGSTELINRCSIKQTTPLDEAIKHKHKIAERMLKSRDAVSYHQLKVEEENELQKCLMRIFG